MKPRLQHLFEAAEAAQSHSHSPYSGAKIGAAILTRNGEIFVGCNVENSTYGATVCAERSAVSNMVSYAGAQEIVEICVVSDASPPWPPCGICRQVLTEFASDPTIHLANRGGIRQSLKLSKIFPMAFTPKHLK